ncbi:Uu.00g077240.m01.CDS01 [Anthostomella pinea]|uniref:Uu.00g077240.m01.CDS01 n=1 Tax=Anthostomella pinea TaxID=933095 RepID=A0AAI8VW05_9PEZI|nr:Uu.00g077240.m01.CDS01 [Anthostomella pinea]
MSRISQPLKKPSAHRTQSEMLKDYLASGPNVTERLVHSDILPQRTMEERLRQKADDVADLVKQSRGASGGSLRSA